MKKYKSPVFKHIHEEAVDFFKDGIINAEEMKEFDQSCLVSTDGTFDSEAFLPIYYL